MRAFFLLLLASCAGSLPAQQTDMRRMQVAGTCVDPRGDHCDVTVESEPFIVRHLFSDNDIGWVPRDDGMVPRETLLNAADGWRIRCLTEHYVDVDTDIAGTIYSTTGMSTRCKSEGRTPLIEVFMEGWPSPEGMIVAGGVEYTISATVLGQRPAKLFVTKRGSTLRLTVGRRNQIWIRRGLDREERRMLLRMAAALWTAPALRAHEG